MLAREFPKTVLDWASHAPSPPCCIIGLPTPMVLVLRPIAEEQEKLGARQTLDQSVEDALSSGVEPMEILKEMSEKEGLDLTLHSSRRFTASRVRWRS